MATQSSCSNDFYFIWLELFYSICVVQQCVLMKIFCINWRRLLGENIVEETFSLTCFKTYFTSAFFPTSCWGLELEKCLFMFLPRWGLSWILMGLICLKNNFLHIAIDSQTLFIRVFSFFSSWDGFSHFSFISWLLSGVERMLQESMLPDGIAFSFEIVSRER